MNFAAIHHETGFQYSYPLNEEELVINLLTGYDVEQVFIHYGDPYEYGIMGGSAGWKGKREEIYFKKRLADQLWWTTAVKPSYKRCKYFFELHSKENVFFYFEDGILTKEQMEREKKVLQYFIFPWMNPADICKVPGWVNQTIWYQIFPERFCNGNPKRNPIGTKEWQHGSVRNEEFYGGDLEGIIEKLDYLTGLGINGIYMTPIFDAASSHKYDTRDYKAIDPHFGDCEVMKKLVAKAHERGIRVMVDAVFNHSGTEFLPWLDVLEKGYESEYIDWFMIQKWPFNSELKDTREESYYSFAFTPKMPKLNTNNPEVIQYLTDVCLFWIREFKIDGIRFDVGNEVSHAFLKQLRRVLKEEQPNLYLLGEIWHHSLPWLQGDEYDAVMNYPLTAAIDDFWVEGQTKEEFEYAINRCYTMYMRQTNNVLFNLLDSHDTQRLLHKTGNLEVFYQQLAILFSMPGTPCIFYGTEIAMDGAHDPDCRRCMPWSEIEEGLYAERIDIIKNLIQLRSREEALRSPHFHFTNEVESKRVIEYIKISDSGEKIKIYLNCTESEVEIPDGGSILFENGYKNSRLGKNGILFLKQEKK